ncbi:MAG: nucleotidyltransferase domain-containing protein, partial [Deferribacterales bacterium]|nr:nucleotidyltransferase domain-containing protein [Deferribacterales bacterium]
VFDITIDRESLIAKLENILKIWRETIYNAVKEQEKIIGKKAENPFSDNLINHFFPEFRTPVNRIIERELKCLEREHNITVLFAIESGSRAWNMASADSDYDVRFVFKRNIESYISLHKSHDVLEFYLDDEYRECKAESALIDGVGFDLRKYIELLSKSNPTSIEWLMSDIIYLGSNDLPIKEYVKENFNPQALIYHYMSWCRKHYKCIEDNKKVTYKKYLYALRGLLNALYVYKNNSIPFLDFTKTVESLKNYIPSSVYIIIKDIIKIKSQGYEKDVIDRIPMIDSFIKDYLNKDFTTPKRDFDYKVIDTFMIREILSQSPPHQN